MWPICSPHQSNENGALARSFAAALALAGRDGLALPTNLVIIGHSVGAESALYVAGRLAGDGRAEADLRGVLLADPVRSLAGGNLAPALRSLAGNVLPEPAVGATPAPLETPAETATGTATSEPAGPSDGPGPGAGPADTAGPTGAADGSEMGADPAGAAAQTGAAPATLLPILVLAAPAQSCNDQQSGTRAVISGLPDRTFIGAEITTGSHADIFGASVNKVERLTCGLPRQVNIDATRSLAMAWLIDAATGRVTADAYPGGAGYDTLIGKGVISTLR